MTTRTIAMLALLIGSSASAQPIENGGAFPGGTPTGSFRSPAAAARADPAQHPDFTGTWARIEGLTHPDQTKIIPFMTPAAAADWRKKIAAHDFHVPWSFCEPPAFPAMMTETAVGFEFLMTPNRVTMIVADGEVRNITTNGVAPGQPAPAGLYFGNSTGHWEGDTLVVQTTDLRADNQIVMGLPAGTGSTKVGERLRLIGPDRLEDRITVTGPAYLAKPYQVTQVFRRYPGVRTGEFLCVASKNRDTGDRVDLTPPPE